MYLAILIEFEFEKGKDAECTYSSEIGKINMDRPLDKTGHCPQ